MHGFWIVALASSQLASALSIIKLENAITVGGGQGSCVTQITFDNAPNTPYTIGGCVGLTDQSQEGIDLSCDPNECGNCDGCLGNECGCGINVRTQNVGAFVRYETQTEVCSIPGSTPGDIGNCIQREGSGYPIVLS